jgi:outer membrane protein assembly factor BamB
MTGNGDFDGAADFGESFIKLSGAGAAFIDWFTPANWKTLTDVDADLSTGPAVIPGTHLIVGGDKYGQLYLLNGDSMGNLGPPDADDGPVYSGAVIGGMFNFALWNRAETTYIYVQGFKDVVKSYQIAGAAINTVPVSVGSTPVASPRVGMTISAHGSTDGILWETTGDSTVPSVPGTLHAFDAMNLSNELWNSSENASQDSLGGFAKFANPTVANGKVYVATSSGAVVAYGLLCTNRSPSPMRVCSGNDCPGVRLSVRMVGRCLTSLHRDQE